MLGLCYLQGEVVPQDAERGKTNLTKACTLGFAQACQLVK